MSFTFALSSSRRVLDQRADRAADGAAVRGLGFEQPAGADQKRQPLAVQLDLVTGPPLVLPRPISPAAQRGPGGRPLGAVSGRAVGALQHRFALKVPQVLTLISLRNFLDPEAPEAFPYRGLLICM